MSIFEDGGNGVPTKQWYSPTKLHVVTNHRAIVFKLPSSFCNIYKRWKIGKPKATFIH